jgi:3-methyl-2-oxobutanoate hydroxymethyltransferase
VKKILVKEISKLKNKRKITRTTALDFFTAKAIEEAGIDIIGLDGPPMEIFFKGMPHGEQASLDEVILCLEAVRRGAPNTFIMVPVPYGYASINEEETSRTAVTLMKRGADAVKIEGTEIMVTKIKKLVMEGIPCVGHVGLNTQKAKIGGFHSVGKSAAEAVEVYEDAVKLQETGVVWIELECVPYRVAEEITKRLEIPTIGVGSGPGCDGQFLHCEDMLGMHNGYYPRHCKKYSNFYEDSVKVLKTYKDEVEKEVFPEKRNSFEIDEKEFRKFINTLNDI